MSMWLVRRTEFAVRVGVEEAGSLGGGGSGGDGCPSLITVRLIAALYAV
jgi:hypothetical protein